MRSLGLMTMAVMIGASSAAHAATATRAAFGTLADGRQVEAVTLANAHGVSARIIAYGATLQSVIAPDAKGAKTDILLGSATAEAYEKTPNYFGVSVGRYANRIGNGRFTLDGKAYTLACNDGTASLHGGKKGFDKQLWTIVSVASGPRASVTLKLRSPDGDEGYPGTLDVTATYTLDETDTLTIAYAATTDRPTIVNLTNHAIWNLGGEGNDRGVLDHRLMVKAAGYTPVDAALIPTGTIAPVAGTPFDFRTPHRIGDRIREAGDRQIVLGRGYDHNYVLDGGKTAAPRPVARVEDPASGRVLELLSDQPGVQVYTGNFLDGTFIGKSGHAYRQGDGIALEPQLFPDTPNKPQFGSARLDPGQTYRNVMAFRFSTIR